MRSTAQRRRADSVAAARATSARTGRQPRLRSQPPHRAAEGTRSSAPGPPHAWRHPVRAAQRSRGREAGVPLRLRCEARWPQAQSCEPNRPRRGARCDGGCWGPGRRRRRLGVQLWLQHLPRLLFQHSAFAGPFPGCAETCILGEGNPAD